MVLQLVRGRDDLRLVPDGDGFTFSPYRGHVHVSGRD